jgi:hypothetical protein
MSKSILNLLVQISKFYQKSEFQIKFEKALFLELGPAPVFGQAAARFLFFQPARSPSPHWASASQPALSAQLATSRWCPARLLPPSWGEGGASPRAAFAPLRSRLTCGPHLAVFLPGLTTVATASRVRMPPPCAASAPITAGAPPPLVTPHHHPGRSPSETAAFMTIMAHHRHHPFLSNAWPPRSPSDHIKGCPGIHSSHRSSPTPPCPVSEPRATLHRSSPRCCLHHRRSTTF